MKTSTPPQSATSCTKVSSPVTSTSHFTSVARTMLQRRIHCVVVWHEPATASDPQVWASSPTSTS